MFTNPIDSVEWVDIDKLKANDYNPNFVYSPELKLLGLSIIRNGWIQPIIVSDDFTIIDGFHRATLVKQNKQVADLTDRKVPCTIISVDIPERIMLTIRMNRAKGSHIAFKMADVIKRLVNDHGYSIEKICEGIGATKDEVNLLLQEDVFKHLKINEHKYSKAWYPKEYGKTYKVNNGPKTNKN